MFCFEICQSPPDLVSYGPFMDAEQEFPPVKDMLPDMELFMSRLIAIKKKKPSMFCRRGMTPQDEVRNLEVDHAAIMTTFLGALDGRTAWESFTNTCKNIFKKNELIKTLDAVNLMRDEAEAYGGNMGMLMDSHRMSYFRQVAWKDSPDEIFNSATVKLVLVLFLMAYITNDQFRHKALVLPPDDYFINKAWLVRGQTHRESLKEMYGDGEVFPVDSVRPVHPKWFALHIPLLDSPIFTHVVQALIAEYEMSPSYHSFKVNFFNQFTTRVSASLKTRIDMVSTLQTRLLATFASLLMAILNGSLFLKMTHFESQVAAFYNASTHVNASVASSQ